ncbi:MAG: GNAT family N-acetyltransferase [Anaerolineaceae bacterium]|nr:GNAT family N-acetyltransferase [Anaerolineaceae bacterium]
MIQLRPITESDLPFLRRLYGSTRTEELAAVPWSAAEKEAFLDMQFHAQHVYYQEQYAQATFDIIEQDGQAIGRLYVDRRPDDIRIVDIALLPANRKQGIGSMLLSRLLEEGTRAGLPITIHVERFNPALTLYQRLGFQPIDDYGVYLLLAWQPEALETAVSPHTSLRSAE